MVLLLLALVGCGDHGLTVLNTDPEVTLLSPEDGAVFVEGAQVPLTARVVDSESPLSDLDLTWATPSGPLVGASSSEGEDVTLTVASLPLGAYDVTVTAIDPAGASGSDTVAIEVLADLPPEITFTSPADRDVFAVGTPVAVRVTVSDDHDEPTDVTLTWSDDADVTGAPAHPSAGGAASLTLDALPLGVATLTVTATDTANHTATAQITVTTTDGDVDHDGYTATILGGDDCDDGDGDIHPGAPERCNTRDDDCDHLVDEPGPNTPRWYLDDDQDTFGDPSTVVSACTAPARYVANALDCDDARRAVNPNATEVCDGRDNDCDTVTDTDAVDQPTWYLDRDGDHFGDDATATVTCDAPTERHITTGGDCDDDAAAAHPGGVEVCDTLDNDCNHQVDEPNPTAPLWYRDHDHDTYGVDTDTTRACAAPAGYADRAGDCDDTVGSTHPGAPETCNGVDDDCLGGPDDHPVDPATYYLDFDHDLFGDPASTTTGCAAPTGYVANSGDCDDHDSLKNPDRDFDHDLSDACDDCDDTDNTVHPGAPELCDGLDNDCVGGVPANETTDFDHDGAAVCEDCDDHDTTRHPGAAETCDGVDQDCDGRPDDGAGVCPCPVYFDALDAPYLFCEDGVNWGDAQVACAAVGYHLASITSATQTQFVRETIVAYPWLTPTTGESAADAWWLGGNRDVQVGADCATGAKPWRWSDGSAWGYLNWRPNTAPIPDEPNNLTGCEGCVEAWYTAEWNDEDCGAQRNFICELR